MSELLIATDARTNEAPDILTPKKLGIRASYEGQTVGRKSGAGERRRKKEREEDLKGKAIRRGGKGI